jgi:hypothetical protein
MNKSLHVHEYGVITDVVTYLGLNAFLFRSTNNISFLSFVEMSDGCRKTWTRNGNRLLVLLSATLEVCAIDHLHSILLAVIQ